MFFLKSKLIQKIHEGRNIKIMNKDRILPVLFKKYFLYLFLERGEGRREKKGEEA